MNLKPTLFLVSLLFLLVGCNALSMDHSQHTSMNHDEAVDGESNNEQIKSDNGKVTVHLEAVETHWMFNDELMDDIWRYNSTLPGTEIRVREGDFVSIKLTNSLDVPTALHLHGVPITNDMDGVPGVTQNAIMPGESFIYEFTADTPGTYWYHSHQDGSNQVGNGLYGVLIVEPKDQPNYDLDKVIMIDEWSSMGVDHAGMDHGDHRDHESQNTPTHAEMMNMMYDTLIINGKAGSAIESIYVEEGDIINLRFVNTGLFT